MLRLENCQAISVDSCGLFGCGTIGVDALDCSDLTVTASRIYECSYSAVALSRCRNVRVEDCDIDSHGVRAGQGEAMMLFAADYSEGFIIHNCRIHDNAAQYLLRSYYSKNTLFLSNDVHDNRITTSMFLFDQYPAVVDGCRFEANDFRFWVTDHRFDPVNVNGEPLEAAELNEMTLRDRRQRRRYAPAGKLPSRPWMNSLEPSALTAPSSWMENSLISPQRPITEVSARNITIGRKAQTVRRLLSTM